MVLGLSKSIIIFALLGLYCIGFAQGDSLTGTWKGYIQEQGHESVMVGLILQQSLQGITGTFSILSETGQDVEKGALFAITQTRHLSNRLSFIVLIAGELNNDAVVFELYLQGKRLEGYGHELREGSERMAVHFLKDH
jgi:hypothetical protein